MNTIKATIPNTTSTVVKSMASPYLLETLNPAKPATNTTAALNATEASWPILPTAVRYVTKMAARLVSTYTANLTFGGKFMLLLSKHV